MIQKKSVIGAAAFFVVMALTVGYFALASDIGGRENPLVTVDYLIGLNPQIERDIAAAVNEKVAAEMQKIQDMIRQAELVLGNMPSDGANPNLDELIHNEAFIANIAKEIGEKYGFSVGGELAEYGTRLEIKSGQTIRLSSGSMLVRRGGGATVVNVPGGQAGLVNLTTGGTLANNGVLEDSNLYLVTFTAGREIRCTADSTFYIIGSFSIN
jgi:hypothetical protein